MATYLSYRNGKATLAERIPAALENFEWRIGASPVAVVVNPRNVAEASTIVKALDLATLAVMGCGGVALQEVWLQQAEPKKE